MPRDFTDRETRLEKMKQESELRGTMKKAFQMPLITDKKGVTKELFKRVSQADLDQISAAAAANTIASLSDDLQKMHSNGLKVGDAIPLPYGSEEFMKASLTIRRHYEQHQVRSSGTLRGVRKVLQQLWPSQRDYPLHHSQPNKW